MITISVCIGSACHLKGSYNVISELQDMIEEKKLDDKVQIRAVFCMGDCQKAVAVKVNDGEETYSLSGSNAKEFFQQTILPMVEA
jgi:NADH:ubiquinone oxidoreductase subunit E